MIRPVLPYRYLIYLLLSNLIFLAVGESAKKKLQLIQDRVDKIIAPTNNTTLKMDTLVQIPKKRVSINMFKPLNDTCPPPLQSMFQRFDHSKDTQGNGSRLRLPKVKTEASRKTFACQGTLFLMDCQLTLGMNLIL